MVDATVTEKIDLHDNLHRWVAQGLLGPDEAERIEAVEMGLPAPARQRRARNADHGRR